MEELIFLVQGSAEEPYTVRFIRRSESNISAYCTCPAGENGQYCKHRFNIIDGETAGIVSDNARDVEIVKSWIPGTDIEYTMMEVREIEKEIAKLRKLLSEAKKRVAHAMLH